MIRRGEMNHGLDVFPSYDFSAQMVARGQFALSCLPFPANLDHSEVCSVSVLDPLDPLQLGVHHERPALAVGEDGGILHRHAVCGEALVPPGSHDRVICQHPQWVQGWGDWDGNLWKTHSQCVANTEPLST